MIDKEKNFLSVVVYIHDGEEQLKSFFPVLFKTLKDNFEKYEIICVDDDASDESIDIVKEYAYGLGEVMLTIIHMGGFCGCQAHTSVLLSRVDIRVFQKLGVDLTSEPIYEHKKIYR